MFIRRKKKKDSGILLPQYSFCESIHGSFNTWHIRLLTPAGRKLGGGIDTESLCGRVNHGWDIRKPVELNEVMAGRGLKDDMGAYHYCLLCTDVLIKKTTRKLGRLV